MGFKTGNKLGEKRKRRRGGRPTRMQTQLKKLGADLLHKRLEEGLGSIADAYISLATGLKVGKHHRKLDPATCRHAIERILGPAPRKFILDAQESIETFFEQIQAEMEGKKESGE